MIHSRHWTLCIQCKLRPASQTFKPVAASDRMEPKLLIGETRSMRHEGRIPVIRCKLSLRLQRAGTRADVTMITTYIRELQQANGIN